MSQWNFFLFIIFFCTLSSYCTLKISLWDQISRLISGYSSLAFIYARVQLKKEKKSPKESEQRWSRNSTFFRAFLSTTFELSISLLMCSCVVSFQNDYYSTGWRSPKLDSMHVIFSQSPFFLQKSTPHGYLIMHKPPFALFSRCRNIQILSNIFLFIYFL